MDYRSHDVCCLVLQVLAELREAVCKSYALCKDQVDLSMGMTADMEHAVSHSYNVILLAVANWLNE